jgi:hypothetical protein
MIGQKTFLSRTASSSDRGTVPFVPFALLVPCRHLILGHSVHGAHFVFVTFVPFCSKPHSRFPKAIQGYSSPFSSIQGVLEKVFLFFQVARWFRIRAMGRVPSRKTSRDPQAVPSLSKAVQAYPRPWGGGPIHNNPV